jgi:poly(3-hydroxybutyrate) depolymerase
MQGRKRSREIVKAIGTTPGNQRKIKPMARTYVNAKYGVVFLAGVLVPCLSGACASDHVVIGATFGGNQTSDGSTGSTDGGGETAGPVGCTGNARPASSPSSGYLAIDVKGITRQYVLELPTSYDGITPVPVLFAFHGSGTSGQEFLGQSYGNVRDGAAGRVLLLGPNALSWNGETAWVDPFSGDQGNGVTGADVDLFDALMDHLMANYCIDAGRVFAMGHGDGAIISNQLACLRGNVLRGVGSFAGAGPEANPTTGCTGKVAAFIGHNPKEGDTAECANVSGGDCPWTLLWADTGWPTTQYWTKKNGCGDPGAMPTTPFAGDAETGNPLPCQSFSGCSDKYPVTLCLYDYWDRVDGPHALPIQWGAKAATDFFLALPGGIAE